MERLSLWKLSPATHGNFETTEHAPSKVSTSERSEFTAPKALLETYGLDGSEKEAAAANFLSRLSTESVNNSSIPVHRGLQSPLRKYQEAPAKPEFFERAASLIDWAELDCKVGEDVDRESDSLRAEESNEAMMSPTCIFKKQTSGSQGRSNSAASDNGLDLLAAATAQSQAIDSIINCIRVTNGLPSLYRREKLSPSQARQRKRMLRKQFENSSLCIDSAKSKKLKLSMEKN